MLDFNTDGNRRDLVLLIESLNVKLIAGGFAPFRDDTGTGVDVDTLEEFFTHEDEGQTGGFAILADLEARLGLDVDDERDALYDLFAANYVNLPHAECGYSESQLSALRASGMLVVSDPNR